MFIQIATTSAVLAAGLYSFNKFYISGGKCLLPGRLDGKVAVVTGANSGIGKETTAEMARRGAHVIMACRDTKRAELAKAEILKEYGNHINPSLHPNIIDASISKYLGPIISDQLVVEELDLASMKSIRAFAKRVCTPDMKIDFLINNAGVMACPYSETKDGFEMQIGTNHLGHFLLTELLLPALKNAAPGSRIINLSSIAHYKGTLNTDNLNVKKENYSRFEAYRQSKLANAVHAHHLSQRLAQFGIKTASVHPGVVLTELLKLPAFIKTLSTLILRPFLKSAWEGAQTTLYTILSEDLVSGAYYADCAVTDPLPIVFDDELGSKLFTASEKLVGSI